MTHGTLPSNIIELGDSEDDKGKDFDTDLTTFRIAASRAHNVASRFEARTLSLKTSDVDTIPGKRDQSPLLDARSLRQGYEQEQGQKQSPCEEYDQGLNHRSESPELGSPGSQYTAKGVVQLKARASGEISSNRTNPSMPSLRTGGHRLPGVDSIAVGLHQGEPAPSKTRLRPTPSKEPTNTPKGRKWTPSTDVLMRQFSRKKTREMGDVAPATNLAHLGSQSLPSHTEEADSKDENNLLTSVFRADIYPLIKTACSQHPSIRSPAQAQSVSRAVRNGVLDILYRDWRLTCGP